MDVRVGCEFVQRAERDTHVVMQVEPRLDGPFLVLDERWESTPPRPTRRYVDAYGNLCRRTTIPAGSWVLRYDAVAQVDDRPDAEVLTAPELAPADLPPEALVYTLPSRYCPSDELAQAAWELFGAEAPGWRRVQAISDWVHAEITFGYGSSTPLTNAADVLRNRAGVCRDFAQLAVTFCRALTIPARYAFGYLPDIGVPPPDSPMDFCAWMEVFLGGEWHTFDPRNNQRRVGRVLIGRGRDALDVAMVTSFGALQLDSMVVWAHEEPA